MIMSNRVTLEQVEQLAVQLSPHEQLKLVAHVSEWLSGAPLVILPEENNVEWARRERLAQIDAWIARCDEVAERWEGEFDSAADLRRIRDED
jgi:hypothetical protein